jgi:hypothetical protein
MNYHLNNLPERTVKPRQSGFTMAMDKGLSVREAEDFVSMAADYVALYEQVLNGHPLHADAPKGIPEGMLQTLPEMEA